MAIRPDYVTGSLTLTSGSANFTTSGSALQAASVQAGDEIITRSGNVLIIASITGQNAGTLMQPCPASAAGAGQPLRIRFQPDGSRYQGAVRDLVEKLASGNVEALAGVNGATKTLPYFTGAGSMDAIAGAANTMPYFTGVNGMGGTPLTPFARTLLDDADAAAMQATLGLTGNAIADMLQDSFGVYITAAGFNLNTLMPGARGLYTNNGGFNFPETSGLWYVETQRMYGTTTGVGMRQTATRYYGAYVGDVPSLIYTRVKSQDAWGPWVAVTAQAGQNTNGSFIVWPGQMQICHGFVSFDASGTVSWTFPKSFSSTPVIHGIGFGTANTGLVVNLTTRSSTSASFRSIRTDTNGAVQMGCPVIAIGAA